MVAKRSEFYSVKLRRKVSIPESRIKTVRRGGRTYLVGTYNVGNKTYEAWKIV